MRHSSSKRLSRTLSVCAAFAMAASLAACSTPGGVGQQSSDSSSESSQSLGIKGDRTGKEILIYMSAGRDYKAYTDTFAAFEKEHNVKINVQYYQWGDLQQKLTADFLSGQTPTSWKKTAAGGPLAGVQTATSCPWIPSSRRNPDSSMTSSNLALQTVKPTARPTAFLST